MISQSAPFIPLFSASLYTQIHRSRPITKNAINKKNQDTKKNSMYCPINNLNQYQYGKNDVLNFNKIK